MIAECGFRIADSMKGVLFQVGRFNRAEDAG